MILDRTWVLLLFLLLTCVSFPSFAATKTVPISSYKQFSIAQGLSQVTILDIEADLNGYVWLATQAGLDRFDGYNFTNVNSPSTLEHWLPKGMVMDIELDETTGDMWFAARVGLYALRAKTGEFVSYSSSLEALNDQETMAVHADDEGNIWVGTQRSVYFLKKGEKKLIPIWDKPKSIAVNDIVMSKDKQLWVATNSGVHRYDTVEQVWLPSLLSDIIVSILHFDDTGDGWVGSGGNGVYVFEQASSGSYSVASHITMRKGLVNAVVTDIKQSADGDYWVATTDGISVITKSKKNDKTRAFEIANIQTFNTNSADAAIGNVLSLYLHPDNIVFVGSLGKGFTVAEYGKTVFDKIVFDETKVPYSVSIQNDDKVWVATENGLYKLDSQSRVEGPYLGPVNGTEPEVSKILQDLKYSEKHQTLFVGSRLGLKKFNPETLTIDAMAFPRYLVYSISETEDGLLLLGTRSAGLYLYNPESEKIVHHWDIPLSFNVVSWTNNQVFVPTTNGLYLIDLSSFETQVFTHDANDPTSLPYNVVTWISRRNEHEFFVGTQSKGLQLMTYTGKGQAPVFTQLFKNTDLSRLSIGAVVKDASAYYWVTTTESIVRMNESLDEMTVFTKSDGVNASGYFIGAYDVNSKGHIYFAGVDSLTYFDPKVVNKKALAPNLQFTNVKTLDSEQKQMRELPLAFSYKNANSLTLPANNIVLSIEFAATEFSSPDRIQYAYMLEGFHKQWQYTSSRLRTATFTNLAPGEYTFKVKASDRYQTWYEQPIELKITVLTPWYMTNVAIFIWLFLLFLVLLGLYKWRMYSINHREEVLTKLVAEKTLDLESANEKLRQLSIRDPLTHTLNRRGFKECADRELAKYTRVAQSFSIILLDVDHFKLINYSYGHELGDAILVEISKAIQQSLRKVDVMARWGGEEFIILLPDTKIAAATSVANKLKEVIANNKLQAVHKHITVTFSAGVSEISEHADLDNCIIEADRRLYKAKEKGRNLVCSE